MQHLRTVTYCVSFELIRCLEQDFDTIAHIAALASKCALHPRLRSPTVNLSDQRECIQYPDVSSRRHPIPSQLPLSQLVSQIAVRVHKKSSFCYNRLFANAVRRGAAAEAWGGGALRSAVVAGLHSLAVRADTRCPHLVKYQQESCNFKIFRGHC